MSNHRRIWVPGSTHFFTVNLLERRRRLLVDRIDDLRAAFRQTRATRSFEILAIVVLPDHLHCLWQLPADDADNASRWAQIKSGFSRRRPVEEGRSAGESPAAREGSGNAAIGSIRSAMATTCAGTLNTSNSTR